MNLPKNGSVVIIDDQIVEALPLMNALAKRGVSYSYYDGKSKNYPAVPLDNVRLIFLDMHLDETAVGTTNTKNIISLLVAGISAIVSENNGPYAVMVWSKHDSQHLEELKDTLLNRDSVPCKPIAVLNMEKALCFEAVSSSKDGIKIEWKLKNAGMDIIEQNLKTQLELVDSFLIFCNWENGIKKSAKETIRAIGALFDNDNQNWNENLKVCMARMAKAYAGQTLEMSDENIIRNVYYSMNSIVNDFNGVEVEQGIKTIAGEVSLLPTKEGINGEVMVSLILDDKEYILSHDEKKYYIYEEGEIKFDSGELKKIFKSKDDGYNKIRELLRKMYMDNISLINSLLNVRNYILDQKRPGNIYESSQELKKEICEAHKIDEAAQGDVKGIELEISPICDYAQNKRKRHRILPGLEIPAELVEKDPSKYTYLTIPLMIEGKVRRILFDFRFYTSEDINYLNEKEPLYAIGDDLLQNIKDELSAHGVRSGIICIE